MIFIFVNFYNVISNQLKKFDHKGFHYNKTRMFHDKMNQDILMHVHMKVNKVQLVSLRYFDKHMMGQLNLIKSQFLYLEALLINKW